jgi:branched-subunit amino acid aminotransferase/4-amino-4-deoxychorismate lyase
MSSLPVFPNPELPDWLQRARAPYQKGYYAMFSSLLGGIVTDPLLMQVPVDDHLVHRGDGVFETIKCVNGSLYLLLEHLDRLRASATAIGLACPWTREALVDITRQTVRAGKHPDCLIRILLSRGPGSLGVNPYDCPHPGLYILAHELKPSFMALHPGGARVAISRIPVKPSFFATIKACNYLPNALMKKEAVDLGVDFTVAFDEQGALAEGATENAGILTAEGDLRVPKPDRILAGTTMHRVLELARPLVESGLLRSVGVGAISRVDISRAREIFIFGTTPDVTAVVEFEGHPVGDGTPGPVARELGARLERDLREPSPRLSPT